MSTERTAKVQAEIERTKAKLAEQQAKLKELEQKKTELENTEIVETIRGMNIPLDGLAAALQAVTGGAAPALIPAQHDFKSKATIPEKEDNDKEEDTE